MAKKRNLYDNIRRRKKAGTTRSKAKSTIKPSVYKKMKKKTGPFKKKKQGNATTYRRMAHFGQFNERSK